MLPDSKGHFGPFGGRFIPETLMPAVVELAAAYRAARRDPQFRKDLDYYLREYAGRPTPLTFAERFTRHCGGAKVYLKREDLLHTGAHKINNTLGQALLARRMGKKRVIAETGAGQHGVATAAVAALFGFECAVYMGEEDIRRQALNVFRMRTLGARVVPVALRRAHAQGRDERGDARLDGLLRDDALHHRLGRRAASVPDDGARFPVGDRPRDAPPDAPQGRPPAGRGRRLRRRRQQRGGHVLPVRRGQGGAADRRRGGRARPRQRPARGHADEGLRGILHGSRSYVLQDGDGQTLPVHSVSAGLDYPGVGPEHATGRRPAARSTSRRRTSRRWTPSGCSRAWRGSSPRWNRRTPSRTPPNSRRR